MQMKFVLDKWVKIALEKGKLVHSQNLMLDINRGIQESEKGKT
jgi:hypothetical protein